jgi:cytoskeleton protein RodZ
MTDQGRGEDATLFPRTVGERLRAAREAKGLSLPEVAARTRVPLRHLEAIEASDFAGLPSATYAVGFVRSYARAVDADEVKLAHDTRIEVANTTRATPAYQPYEIADPKRVPSKGVVIVATGVGIAVLVLAALFFATSLFRGGQAGVGAPPVVADVPIAAPRPTPTPAAGGQVRLTATDEVWVRIYDAADTTLKLGTMKAGETFDVPPTANNPMINVGRPDKLAITLNGSAVAPLGTGERAIKDVPIGAAALAARAAGQPAPAPSPSASGSPSASASTTVPTAFAAPAPSATSARRQPSASRTPERPRPRPSPSRTGPENLLPSGFATPTP